MRYPLCVKCVLIELQWTNRETVTSEAIYWIDPTSFAEVQASDKLWNMFLHSVDLVPHHDNGFTL